MGLTQQQTQILNHCVQVHKNLSTTPNKEKLVLVDSVAGSGKTTLLVNITKAINPKSGLMLAYNKAIATESKGKFPSSVRCSTTHSLAYQTVIPALKLRVNASFSYRDIQAPLSYDDKLHLIDSFREFCLSSYISWDDFCSDHQLPKHICTHGSKLIDAMYTNKIPCTHDFYLKVFHIWLHNGDVTYDTPFDILMLDEAGDLNRVTMEIFKLLPANLKIAVGDQHQNIYTFNHTINCFTELAPYGTLFPMSQSFRVSPDIAAKVQLYGRKHFSPTFTFLGTPQPRSITSEAYISRTNASLVGKMIECNLSGTPYVLTRKADEIFRLPRLLCYLKHNGFIADPAYRYLQEDVDNYYTVDTNRKNYKSLYSYLLALHEDDDIALTQALKIILRYGRTAILDAYVEAKNHEKLSNVPLTLCTAHSSKGLEFDSVTFDPDMDSMLLKSLSRIRLAKDTLADYENLNLYYVACSRASIQLNNAHYLEYLWNTSHKSPTK